jgi:taurine--2-oxoglutarate transaminase
MADEGIVDNARQIGQEILGPGLQALAAKYPLIGQARGIGLFWALEFVSDVKLKTPLAASVVAQMKAQFQARGLLTFTVENRLHVVPPCIVNAAQVAEALAIFDEVIGEFSARHAR